MLAIHWEVLEHIPVDTGGLWYIEEQNADVGSLKALKQVNFYKIVYLLCARFFLFSFFLGSPEKGLYLQKNG